MSVIRISDHRESGGDDKKSLPASADLEREFLGALIIQNAIFPQIAGFLKAEHFSEEIHRRIFAVISGAMSDGKAVTFSTILPFLGDGEVAEGITIRAYLARVVAEACAPAVAKDYALMIRDLFARREIIGAAEDVMAQAYDAPVNMRPAEMAVSMIDRIAMLTEDPSAVVRLMASASAYKVVARAQAIAHGEKSDDLGVSTGFDRVDTMAKYRAGDLWIVAGRPGMGKSIVAASSALRVAQAGHGVMFFSCELPEDQFAARLLADLCYAPIRPITFQRIMRGDLDDDELRRLDWAQRTLGDIPMIVDYTSKITIIDIRARIHAEKKRLAAKGQVLRVAYIDYLKFIQATDRYRGHRVYEVGEISAGLKQIAKDEGVCIVLLAQLSRATENREDKRPGLADLRDSGDLEMDADVVAFIYRESYYIERSPEYRKGETEAVLKFADKQKVAELIIGKNRAGPTGTATMFCHVGAARMADVEEGHD